MTASVDTYRIRAHECLAQARRAPEDADKATFLEMAEEWLSLAAAGEQTRVSASVYPLVG